MAELSDADMKAIMGLDWKRREVTEEARAEKKAAHRISLRNTGIGIAVVAAIILLTVFFGPSGR